MTKRVVLNPFTLNPNEHSNAHSLSSFGPSLTVQSEVEQSDINFIVKQFGVTGMLPYGRETAYADADYSDMPTDYHTALNIVRDSNGHFMELPADVRKRFNNDPGSFIDFMNNPDNFDEAVSLGIVNKPSVIVPPPEPKEPTAPDGDGGGDKA